ncbi:DUF1028 domain-containing protein [Cellulomonas marina]|uniref:Uncharacterized conserved protein, Ntn-hydrolase superfamily n=1 Tax=Cellulomonas marina TaxID=988821 RepID=A0A1I0Y6S9_9CELL|nr:DUF1028 domain-containing protein [Cellulomonas marina]GIG29804.1 hypothetical protein Cma02nite_24040 [Cellulomonas marina]SFB08456.1 Uncharacterized conserved protein, Ntn-hydrolase superfamily [Cellulomonas marina]
MHQHGPPPQNRTSVAGRSKQDCNIGGPAAPPSAARRDQEPALTFTILALDRQAGLLGGATASRSLAAANAVLAVAPHLGAAASQAWTNRRLRGRLLGALAAGDEPARAVERVPEWDPEPELRQVAVLALDGRAAHRTGTDCTAWAGGRARTDLVVVGNLLAGPQVLDAMVEAWDASGAAWPEAVAPVDVTEGFARRLVAALRAGEEAGGDLRGRQSAGVAVARTGDERLWPPQLAVDLRCDDGPDPIEELDRLLRLPGAVVPAV